MRVMLHPKQVWKKYYSGIDGALEIIDLVNENDVDNWWLESSYYIAKSMSVPFLKG